MKNRLRHGGKLLFWGILCGIFWILFTGCGVEEVSNPKKFIYEVLDEGVTIHGYKGKAKKLVIPAEIEGKPVVKISSNAFFELEEIVEEIELPDTVTQLEDQAFISLRALKRIALPDSVTQIGFSAFEWCDSLEEVTLPQNMTQIPERMFVSCKSLKTVEIPEQVEVIGWGAFMMSGLTEITLPDSVKRIEGQAFEECVGLTRVTVGNNVESIGRGAFWECGFHELFLPESITEIQDNAFTGPPNELTFYVGENQVVNEYGARYGIPRKNPEEMETIS